MSSEKPPLSFHQRNFGHCIVSWKIKNYLLAACNPGTEIKSTPFEVHSWQNTCWQIAFRVKLENKKCQVLLKRLSDTADETIDVTWCITMFGGYGKRIFIMDGQFCFHQNSQHATDFLDPSDMYQVLESNLDEVQFEIQMIVFMKARMRIPTLSDIDKNSLVNHLKYARINNLHADLIIHLDVKDISVHRALLLTRSKTLEQANGSRNSRTYFVDKDDIQAFDSLVTYLYTSDLSYIFETPSVSMYKHIVDLDVTELLDAYPQEKISMETIIKGREFKYRWTVPDFIYNDNLPNSNMHEASGRNSNGMDWQLRIFPKEVAEDTETHVKYLYLEASIVNNVGPKDVVICIKAKKDGDPIPVVKRQYGKIERDMKLGTKFMRIENLSAANSFYKLEISFSLHIATGTQNSIIKETRPPVDFRLTNSVSFSILQSHLKDLLEKSLYSDITLWVENHEFKCHKFLLAARSPIFSRILETTWTSLHFRNINRNVFSVFLYYLYTGALPTLGTQAASKITVIFLMHLYQLSLNFTAVRLTCLCLDRLVNELSQQNSCCMLLFASERCLTQLKYKILNLFSLHPDIVVHNDCIMRLKAKDPQLFLDIAARLRTNSYRTEFDLDAELFVPPLLTLDDMMMSAKQE